MSLDAYVEHVRELLDGVSELRFRKMFGGVGVYSGAQMFALVIDEQLYLKADDPSREALAALGSEPFAFEARGRLTTTSYWRLPAGAEEDPAEARRWARRALEAAQAARRPTRRSAPASHDLGPGPWDE
ncbi:MAG: TfoX/Sxy family protein [Pseudomonadota bacterium]|nr:TfoX/Sxy family protein [Pseudomonadota bacterium]